MTSKICTCGREFEPETPAQDFCSPECYRAAGMVEQATRNLDANQPAAVVIPSRIREAFPMLQVVWEHAEVAGPCRGLDWRNTLAHAHEHAGVVCVRGPAEGGLWGGSEPTSLLLHEYAHIIEPGGHTPMFWQTNKALHKRHGVMHAKFEQAIASVVMAVLFIAAGLGLWFWTGVGWFGFGAVFAILLAIPALIDSFGTEEADTEHIGRIKVSA